ncbi:Methyltransferase domain-containing protein [Arachidicoccus rhizosphaerae]|jgi:SAM-dependent methyltransferase|uniref:Methyltransferase domain-containing protein n=1 Tax=Arachidicoccus rhizosphaerae TaxID=551991 RepID=A0A1H4AF05_9BACT|nr:class I SAM-dependent methyltransferase [Arachidicoccus rhizosphaerae]SEA34487.1 Methyltransferase domain-containing protein [Arachidicoccus rhizosphaerae]
MSEKNTERFSNRVGDYVKFRPHYPKEILPFLQTRFQIDPIHTPVVADIGSGTGISAELFLSADFNVTGVEPNKEMREKSLELLGTYEKFHAVEGTAEATGLADHFADVIIAGQAFHWFDKALTKPEFKRILKENGYVLLIWNERLTRSSFEKDYEDLIRLHGRNYLKVDHRNIHLEDIQAFFHPGTVSLSTFTNYQRFDFEGLKGRLLSSSYMPTQTDPGYAAMVSDLQTLFNTYQQEGFIQIDYDTNVYIGQF